MRKQLLASFVALTLGLAVVGAACSADNPAAQEKIDEATTTTEKAEVTTTTAAPAGDDNSIAAVATEDPQLSTLVSLVQEAGLADLLGEGGPYTVLAPTNAAFAAVPATTLESLQADPLGALANVLRLHVIVGGYSAVELTKEAGSCVDTLGGKVVVQEAGEGITFGGAQVVESDIEASNGTIHLLDGVVLRPATDAECTALRTTTTTTEPEQKKTTTTEKK